MSETHSSAPQLDHERLDAYTAAVALDALVVALTRSASRGHAWLADQAQRAALAWCSIWPKPSAAKAPTGRGCCGLPRGRPWNWMPL